jgi:hypothetical protein
LAKYVLKKSAATPFFSGDIDLGTVAEMEKARVSTNAYADYQWSGGGEDGYMRSPTWPGGQVPYTFDASVSQADRNNIVAAMQHVSASAHTIRGLSLGSKTQIARSFTGQG